MPRRRAALILLTILAVPAFSQRPVRIPPETVEPPLADGSNPIQPVGALEPRALPAPVRTLDAQTARRLGLAASTEGVAVVNVESGSAAAESGLQHGDIIVEVNRQAVRNEAEFASAMNRLGNGTAVLFVNSGGRTHYVTIRGMAGR